MFEVQNLSYVIEEKTILEELSFTIPKGVVTAIVGPNGVGKTTTVQILAGIIQSSNKYIRNILNSTKITYLDLEYLVFEELKSQEFLQLIASYNNKSDKELQEIIKYFEPMNISSFLQTKLKGLSLGQQQKLLILTGFLSDTEILIFDEPFNGLDFKSEVFLKEIFKQNPYNFTIVITTHNFVDIESYTKKCIFIENKSNLIELYNNNVCEYLLDLNKYLGTGQEV